VADKIRREVFMFDRRRFLMAASLLAIPLPAAASPGGISRGTAYTFSFRSLEGADIQLSDQTGKPMLVVNTASLCGFTPQYAGLETLWLHYRERGLFIVAVPSNDFGGQEPGGAEDIHHTAHRHGVTFPIAEKVSVRGPQAHPFYRWAALQRPTEIPRWNFHKYLVGRDGTLIAGFGSAIDPTDTRIVVAIERELAAA
jgi:glutathione peroxidase